MILVVLEKIHWHELEAASVRVQVAAAVWVLTAGLWAHRWAKKASRLSSPG